MLSPREIQISGMIAKGMIEKEIADRLHIAFSTVHAHTKNIRRKLKAGNIADITRNHILTYDSTFRNRIATAFRAGRIVGTAKSRAGKTADKPKRGFPSIWAKAHNEPAELRQTKPKKTGKPNLLQTGRTHKTNPMKDEISEKIDRLMWLQINCTIEELDKLIRFIKELKEMKNENSTRNR